MNLSVHLFSLKDIVPWRKSRHILYWRLRRLLLENELKSRMMSIQGDLTVGQAEARLRRWFIEDRGATEVINNFNTSFGL